MRAHAPVLIALAVLLTSPGCATVLQGRYQDLTINSNPPGAVFEVDGMTGTTPGTVSVRRKVREHVVTISKPGYETARISVGRDRNVWLAGNLVFGLLGLPGLAVDFASGSAYELNSNTVGVSMIPDGSLAQRAPINSPAANPSPIAEAQYVQPPPKPPR